MRIDDETVEQVVAEVVRRLREEDIKATPPGRRVECSARCPIDFTSAALKRIILWRVDPGCDLMESLSQRLEEEKVSAGAVLFMVGTLREARVGFFVSKQARFHVTKFAPEGGLELVAGSGTLAIQEGTLMPHIHIVFADDTGLARGGHLFPGTIVKEYVEGALAEFTDVKMERMFREQVRAFPLFFDGRE